MIPGKVNSSWQKICYDDWIKKKGLRENERTSKEKKEMKDLQYIYMI